MNFKIGHGYDVHQLVIDRDLILGGVKIEYNRGLLGHSDADVVVHAIIDALIGAVAMGDIGAFFPDSYERFKDADSLKLLAQVVVVITEKGYQIGNIDSTILAQSPKLAPYIQAMRRNIARVCLVELDCVSVKATTEEHLGFTGRKEGIAAHAVVILEKIIF